MLIKQHFFLLIQISFRKFKMHPRTIARNCFQTNLSSDYASCFIDSFFKRFKFFFQIKCPILLFLFQRGIGRDIGILIHQTLGLVYSLLHFIHRRTVSSSLCQLSYRTYNLINLNTVCGILIHSTPLTQCHEFI